MDLVDNVTEISVIAAFLLAARRASLSDVAHLMDRSVSEVQHLMRAAGLTAGNLPAFAHWVKADPDRQRAFLAIHPAALQIWPKKAR